MQSAPVAAAPASRLNESAPLADYFEVFGLPRRFGLDRAWLERRFYELSRQTHPDRFATQGAAAQQEASQRMSVLNEAYGTLKDPERLRAHYLELAGLEPKASQPPLELAESWFELQDVVMEHPDQAPARIAAFESQLATARSQAADRLSRLEHELDAQGWPASPAGVERLAAEAQLQSYFKSLERDIQSVRRRVGKTSA